MILVAAMVLLYHQSSPGQLYLTGGGKVPGEVYNKFIEACGKGLIVVLPQTQARPEKTGDVIVRELKEHGAKEVSVLASSKPSEFELSTFAGRLAAAKGIWVPSGDPTLFLGRFRSDWLQVNLVDSVKKGAHFFGSGGGAMLPGAFMITGQNSGGLANTTAGLSLTPWVIDTYFRERKREKRLSSACEIAKSAGIGLSEADWVVIKGNEVVDRGGQPALVPKPNS